ncbi:MAG TPA: CheR family methyltransferase [Abditibacteriaceae bacterium]|jgi:chemotaxis protein methyltransferase CheR
MTEELLQKFTELIAARTGLHVRDKDRTTLVRGLEARMSALSLVAPESYLCLIERAPGAREGEWKHLLPLLTNGESYFLRDKGQLSLIQTRILPDLMAQRKREKTLRVWSAGCSTGEEVYSLAMIFDGALPRGAGWNVSIVGTDINEESLAKARRGVYGEWAFRALDETLRRRYFQDGNEVNAALRSTVSFRTLNLRDDDWPSRTSGIFDIDLILCRNVLIYFRPEAVAHTLSRLTAALRPCGFLLTGHAELAGHNPAPLQVRAFPESVAYQKPAVGAEIRAPQPSPRPERAPTNFAVKAQVQSKPTVLVSAETLRIAPVAKASTTPNSTPVNAAKTSMEELCNAARRFADIGNYADAVRCCREAIAVDIIAPHAYFLWAQVAAETGSPGEAKDLLKKVIYLAPTQPDAYLELAALYEAEGDAARAKRMRETALDALRTLPAGATLTHSNALAVDVARHLEETSAGHTAPQSNSASRAAGRL